MSDAGTGGQQQQQQGGQQQQQQGGQQQQQQGGQQQQQQQQQAWFGQVDDETKAYIANKGWTDVGGLLKSYRGAEKMIGRDPESLFQRPQDGDAAGWAKFYDRLGRPASADKYDLRGGLPEGFKGDEAFMKSMSEMFHRHGLTAAQAAGLAKDFNAAQLGRAQQSDSESRAMLATQKAELLAEWKGGYERHMNAAQTAVAALGFTEAEIDALEGVLGYKGVMTKFAALGKKLSDPQFISGDATPRFGDAMAPAEARAEIEKLKMDKDFRAALYGGPTHPGRKAAQERWTKLHQVAHPD